MFTENYSEDFHGLIYNLVKLNWKPLLWGGFTALIAPGAETLKRILPNFGGWGVRSEKNNFMQCSN